MGTFLFDVPVLLQESDGQRAKNGEKPIHQKEPFNITVLNYSSLL